MTFGKTLIQVQVLLVIVTGCQTTNSNKSTSNNNINVSEIKNIIIGDANNKYEFKTRNLPIKNVLRILKHDGMLSARLRLSKSMKGHKDDRYRSGQEGHVQRSEYASSKKQVLNKEVWTRLMFWLPENTDLEPNGQTVSMFDIKERLKGQTYGPMVALQVRNRWNGTILKIKHSFEKNDCIKGDNSGGGDNSFCDKIETDVIIGPISKFVGRWVEFVSHAIWSGDKTGRYNSWLDGEKIIGYHGPTVAMADKMAFKFGVYRINLNRYKNANDFEVFYSKVGTANKCEKLKSIHCSKIKKSLEVVGYQNLQVERHV